MNRFNRIFTSLRRVILMALLSASATAQAFDVREVTLGTRDAEVRKEYGAPDKKQFESNFEIWNYISSDAQNCRLYFQKKVLVQPVTCAAIPREPAKQSMASSKNKRGFASSQ